MLAENLRKSWATDSLWKILMDAPVHLKKKKLEDCLKKNPDMNKGRCLYLFLDKQNYAKIPISPLMFAVFQREKELVELLLKYGADPNWKDQNKNSALFLVTIPDSSWSYVVTATLEKPSLELAQLLLSYGADPTSQNNQGKTFLDYLSLPLELADWEKVVEEEVMLYQQKKLEKIIPQTQVNRDVKRL